MEDPVKESYGLYCREHYEKNIQGSINGPSASPSTPQTPDSPREAGPSKAYCFACENTEGNISLERLSDSIIMFYCDQHAPSSQKKITNGDSAGPSSYICSNTQNSSKRRLSPSDKEEETPTKRRSKNWKRNSSNKFPHSDDDEPNADISIFAPIETDLSDLSTNSAPFSRRFIDSPAGSPSGNQMEEEKRRGGEEEETITGSDAESESLLDPGQPCLESQWVPQADHGTQTSQCSVPLVKCELEPLRPAGEGGVKPASDCSPDPSGPRQSSNPDPSGPDCDGVPPPGTSRDALPPPTGCPLDSVSFWRSCNMAGCTQAIFTQFTNQMNDIAAKIQSDRASQEDYDCALSVMAASGRMADIVAKQQEELQKKQVELQKAAAAMMNVVTGLRKNP